MTDEPPNLHAGFAEELILFQSHLLDAVLQPVVVSDVEGRVIYWNDACEAQYGWTHEEALGRDVMEFLSNGDLAAETQSIEGTVRDDLAWAGEMELRRKDGSVFSAMCTASPIPGPDGQLAAVLGIATDLTRVKNAEQALRERVKELRTLREASRVMNRPDVPLSSRLRELVDVIPGGWLYPELTEARVIVDGMEASSDGFRTTPWMQSTEIQSGGRVRGRLDVAVTARPPGLGDGPVLTEERTLIDALALSLGEAIERNRLTGLLEQTFANLDEAVVITASVEEGRRIIDVNPATERIFGYRRDELVGTTSERLHLDREAFERFAREASPVLERKGVFTASYPLRRKDGTVIATEQTVTLLDPDRGPVGGVVNVVRDVSDRAELEEKLRQSQKMEAVGRLAGGIAHDFNNLLTVIQVQTDLMLMDDDVGLETTRGLRLIQDTTRRAARLTSQLLAFSREQVLAPQLLELGAVVEATTQMLDRLIGDDVVLDLDLAADAPPIAVDSSQLEQAIMNLVVNARDAMPEGGLLTISTATHTIEQDPDLEPGEYVALRVTDTGMGIPPDSLHKIFEPFYSTKAPGKGTGLGLAMAYGFARQSGGTIRVDSEPGERTTFELLFPAADPGAFEDATATEPAEEKRPPRIWLVEDSDVVRRLTGRLLQRRGYGVDPFPDAESALAHAKTGAEIDVVITDVGLPGVDGPELAEKLRQLRPGLGIVVISGRADGEAERLPADAQFVRKPFEPSTLLEAIQHALLAAKPAADDEPSGR